MKVSAWKGGTYGLRIAKADKKHFHPDWRDVVIEIDGHDHTFRLSSTFWTTCPEVRGAPIKRWLQDRGLIPWPSGRPPKVTLMPLGGNRFRLLP